MRYLVVCVLVGLLAWPQSVAAQIGDTFTASKPTTQEPVSESAAEQPPLWLKLDEAGVEVVEMQRRVRNAKIGLGISGVSVLVGGVLMGVALRYGVFPDDPDAYTARDDRIGIAALTLTTGGVASLVATGILLSVRKGKLERREQRLRELQRDLRLGGRSARPQARRAQWDLVQSRLVF